VILQAVAFDETRQLLVMFGAPEIGPLK